MEAPSTAPGGGLLRQPTAPGVGQGVLTAKPFSVAAHAECLRRVFLACDDPETAIGALYVALREAGSAEKSQSSIQLLDSALNLLLLYDVRNSAEKAHPAFNAKQLVTLKCHLVLAQLTASYAAGEAPHLPRAYLHACGLLYEPRFVIFYRAAREAAMRNKVATPTQRRGRGHYPAALRGRGGGHGRGRGRGGAPRLSAAALARRARKAAHGSRKEQRRARRQRKEQVSSRAVRAAILSKSATIVKMRYAMRQAEIASLTQEQLLVATRANEVAVYAITCAGMLPEQAAAYSWVPPSLLHCRLCGPQSASGRSTGNASIIKWHADAAAAEAARRVAARTQRMVVLRGNDYAAYRVLLKQDTTERVKALITRTDAFLGGMARKLESEQKHARLRQPDGGSSGGDGSASMTPVVGDVQAPLLLQAMLRPYQLTGLRWLVSLHRGGVSGCLADEMGLGKTLQIIALLCHLTEATPSCTGPFLIILPSSVVTNWVNELSKFAPHLSVCSYTGPEPHREKVFATSLAGWLRSSKKAALKARASVCLTTFETVMAKRDTPRLARVPWQYLIMDEAHRIKNGASKLNVLLRDTFGKIPHRLLITGTPVQNNLTELFTLLQFLMPRVFAGEADAFVRLFDIGQTADGEDLPSAGDAPLPLDEEERLLLTQRLHEALRPFMLRRVKESVASDLPAKREVLIRVRMTPYQRHLYDCVLHRCATAAVGQSSSSQRGAVRIANVLMELRTVCNHPFLSKLHNPADEAGCQQHPVDAIVRHCAKLEALDKVLGKMRVTGHRALIFCTMTRVLDVLEEYLAWRGYSYVRLDGGTTGDARGDVVNSFQRKDSSVFCFLLSTRAGGFGLNLQAADTVIMYDTDWNPQVDAQAQARSHRIGQDKDVLSIRFECIASVEEAVRTRADAKRAVAERAITGGFFDAGDTSEHDRNEFLKQLMRTTDSASADGSSSSSVGDADTVLSDDAINALLARAPEEVAQFAAEDARRSAAEQRFWARMGSQPMPPRLADSAASASLIACVEARSAAAAQAAAGSDEALGRGVRGLRANLQGVDHGKSMDAESTRCSDDGGGSQPVSVSAPVPIEAVTARKVDRSKLPKKRARADPGGDKPVSMAAPMADASKPLKKRARQAEVAVAQDCPEATTGAMAPAAATMHTAAPSPQAVPTEVVMEDPEAGDGGAMAVSSARGWGQAEGVNSQGTRVLRYFLCRASGDVLALTATALKNKRYAFHFAPAGLAIDPNPEFMRLGERQQTVKKAHALMDDLVAMQST